MSRQFRRQPRPRLALAGDFGDETITEALNRADHDGRTWEFTGASSIGLPDDTQPVAIKQTGRDTEPFAAARAKRRAWHRDRGQHVIADGLAHGWPRLFEIRCAYPAARHDTPIPCDQVFTDPAAATFTALRESARAAGWNVDAHGRDACPACSQASPAYRTPYPVMLWAGGAHPAAIEHDLIRDVRDAARRGRHHRTAAS